MNGNVSPAVAIETTLLRARVTTTRTQDQSSNPLVPAALDGVLMVVSLIALFLAFAAFVSLLRSTSTSGRRLLAWVLVVLFVPLVGPSAWFIARRRGHPVEPDGGDCV